MSDGPAVELTDLTVVHPGGALAVDALSLTVPTGRCVAVLGESGSGESTLCRALLGLNDDATTTGSLRVEGREVVNLSERAWRSLRWTTVAMAFQATTALDPLMTVGRQIAEPMTAHLGISTARACERAADLLVEVGLPPDIGDRLPRELSGGQRRLALVAAALACAPRVLVLDEPSAGLDPVARAGLIATLQRVRRERGTTMLVVTHDVGVAAALADDVVMLYRGWIAETGPAATVLTGAESPYGFGLLNAVPTVHTVKDLRGLPPDPDRQRGAARVRHAGCPFAGRCHQEIDRCTTERPPLLPPDDDHDGRRLVACHRGGLARVVEVRGVVKEFRTSSPFARRPHVRAVDGVDLVVRSGEVVGVAGLNGAGKSTLVSLLAGHLDPDAGTVVVDGIDTRTLGGADRRRASRSVQLVQQDPFLAVSPHATVEEAVTEPLEVARPRVDRATWRPRVLEALQHMRLPTDAGFLSRRAHTVSGGELQRISIARALIARPKVLVLDEPVSMLDPSEQAEVLQLVKAAQVATGTAVVLVSHDLAVLLRTADRIVVLEAGRIVEEGAGADLYRNPRSAVLRQLLFAAGVTPGDPASTDPPTIQPSRSPS